MTFEKALKALRAGDRVTREDWTRGNHWLVLNNGTISMGSTLGLSNSHRYPGRSDLLAEDWKVHSHA